MRDVDLEDVELTVVDLTRDPRYPKFSVRMPIYEIIGTHEREYIEILYRIDSNGQTSSAVNLSPQISDDLVPHRKLHEEWQKEIEPENYPTRSELGTIGNLFTAVKKLYEFDLRRGFDELFAKYGY